MVKVLTKTRCHVGDLYRVRHNRHSNRGLPEEISSLTFSYLYLLLHKLMPFLTYELHPLIPFVTEIYTIHIRDRSDVDAQNAPEF